MNRIHNHLNTLNDVNLMKDFQKDIDFLRTASTNEIIENIEKMEKGENSICFNYEKAKSPFESSIENENDIPSYTNTINTIVDFPTIPIDNLNEEKEKRNKNYSKKRIMNYN